MRGSEIIAATLQNLGVEVVFGIVGIPVIEVADALQASGVRFIGFRNEQSASYAASAYGYMTGRPGVCLVVGGPGVLHAMAGIGNASANGWPLLVLAGSSESHQRNKGAFQEIDQVALLAPHTKLATRPAEPDSIPESIARAFRMAHYGRPGPTYVDLPADFIQATVEEEISFPQQPAPAPRHPADPVKVQEVAALLKSAKAPLVVVGKGAAYAQAEVALRQLIQSSGVPFLPTPMGKGVLSDSHPLNAASARSAALKAADVVVVFGARLNWILHYGEPPRWGNQPTIIQVDIAAEELGQNGGSSRYALLGDAGLVAQQLHSALSGWRYPSTGTFHETLASSRAKNSKTAAVKASSAKLPLTYERTYAEINKVLRGADEDVVFVSEGANTMDTARSAFDVDAPRQRLDAGTHATMGVGMGYAIAAAAVYPRKRILAIEGDSAFGFSAMELETAVRERLPMTIVVMNNNGIYHGLDAADYTGRSTPLPSTALSLETRYDGIAEACGGRGFLVRTPDELARAIQQSLASGKVCVINVLMEPGPNVKLQFGWLASTKKKAKL